MTFVVGDICRLKDYGAYEEEDRPVFGDPGQTCKVTATYNDNLGVEIELLSPRENQDTGGFEVDPDNLEKL